jgi:hypothetical protein
LQVIERVVEVEPDKAAIVEQLRQQMKVEMEQQQQQLEGQALEAARQEAEARAKQQLEVSRTAAHAPLARPIKERNCLLNLLSSLTCLCKMLLQLPDEAQAVACRCIQCCACLSELCAATRHRDCPVQALMAASNASNEQRLALREDLKLQLANMRAMQEAAEKAKAEQQELLTRIAAMESKVKHGCDPSCCRATCKLKAWSMFSTHSLVLP